MLLKIVIFITSPYIFRTWHCKIIFYTYWILTRFFNVQYFLSNLGICKSVVSGLTHSSMLTAAPICAKTSVTITTYMRIFSCIWHYLNSSHLIKVQCNDSTFNLNKVIFRMASISCRKLLNFIKTISLLKKNLHHLPM